LYSSDPLFLFEPEWLVQQTRLTVKRHVPWSLQKPATDPFVWFQFQRDLAQVPPGSNLHGIRIIKKIGDGGFAKVFLCETPSGQQIAVKKWALVHMTPDMVTV
jgi:hypothetical protein